MREKVVDVYNNGLIIKMMDNNDSIKERGRKLLIYDFM